MKHGRAGLFQLRGRGLAAALLLLVGVLVLTDGLFGLRAPRPWALRGGLAEAAAAAAAEQQDWQQQYVAAALEAGGDAQQQQPIQQQIDSAVLPVGLRDAAAAEREAPPPPTPPLHRPEVQEEEEEGLQQQQQQQEEEEQEKRRQQQRRRDEEEGRQQQQQQQQEQEQDKQKQQEQQRQQLEEEEQQQQAEPAADEPLPRGQDRARLAMCIAVKDEHCDIREWVLHHAQLGAGKFYVFDTGSDPPMEPVLEDLIASGLVHYSYLTNTTTQVKLEAPPPGRSFNWQWPIYSLCLQRYGQRHRWMGFIDADEFVMLQEGVPSLPELLSGYERHGGLGLHWQLFTFDRHVERPSGGLLASYTACCGRDTHAAHRHIKSFVQPRFTIGPQTVHSFNYRKGRHAVNTGGERVDGPMLRPGQQVSYQGAVLHHYISRSLADFAVKQERRDGTGSVKQLSDFLNWHRKCTERCTAAVPLGQQLAGQYNLNLNVPPRCLLTER